VSLDIHINRLQHTGLPVTDLAASTAFYETLGFTSVMSSTFLHPEGTGHVSMLQRGDIVLELYEFPAPALDEIRARSNGHIDHVAFDVSDIDATFRTLKSAGHTPLEPAPVFLPFWTNGCKYFNILGPDGERLEFNQIL
jgi:catechol 2,3-dioxygenase-like lactoylglutathione lyase family enzyme